HRFSGTVIEMGAIDYVLEDGRLVYHYDRDRYQVIEADAFKIVYSSQREMEQAMERKREVEDVKKMIAELKELRLRAVVRPGEGGDANENGAEGAAAEQPRDEQADEEVPGAGEGAGEDRP